MKKKIYICGAVTGTDMELTKAKFAAASKYISEELNHEPVNPMELQHNHDKKWESYMRECIKALMDCDSLYLLNGYEESKGVKVELQLAATLGISILKQTTV